MPWLGRGIFIGSPDQTAPGRNYPLVGFGEWVQLDRNGIPGISAALISRLG